MTRIVVDADYIVYAAGFAVETAKYDVASLRPDGSEASAILESRDEAEAWALEEPEGSEVVRDKLVEAEPLANALHLVNKTLHGIETALTKQGVEFGRLELFITGSGNFRDSLATIKGYKANRDPTHKPVHYKALRAFLQERWGAQKVEGIEADDAVAMAAHEAGYDPEKCIIVSVDKDLLTVPGGHYNFKTKVYRVVSPQEALWNFYVQLIKGDPTDNIGGAFKSGDKAAKVLPIDSSEEAMYRYALDLYKKGLGVNGCPYGNMAAEDALLENARLLHLKRHKADVWMPPGQRD